MKIKYPRTFHLPWSPGATSDDKMLKSIEHFIGEKIVITAKMDGENTSCYSDYIHARSIDGRSHPSRDWLKQFHGTFKHNIPDNWRICGENLYAKHSIAYDNLPSYFMVFSIWDAHNNALSWDDTEEWCKMLELCHVPVLYKGIFDESKVKEFNNIIKNNQEGYVVRLAESFSYDNFDKSVAKFVRPNHIQTESHWAHSEIIPNKLMN